MLSQRGSRLARRSCSVVEWTFHVVSPETVAVGETILARPYEKIPLDGVILEGETAVDASALTGESLPQDKKPGDAVASGSASFISPLRAAAAARRR